MIELTQADHAELDTFWATKPAPRTPIRPDQYFGAVTVSITCRVCGKRESQLTSATALLCRRCLNDLDGAEQAVQTRLEDIKEAVAFEMDRWVAVQAAGSDELADRWTRLIQDWQRVTSQLERAQTGKYYNYTPEQIAANVAAKQAAYDETTARIERTRLKGGELARLIDGHTAHLAQLAKLNEEKADAERALSEIDCSREGGAPF